MYSGTSNTAQARAEEEAIARRQSSPTPVYQNVFQSNSTPTPISAKDQEMQRLTDAGWIGSVNAEGKPVGDLGIYQAKNRQAVVDSSGAKTDLQKIQSDFQSLLSSIQNKQQYNQSTLNPNVSLVDLMKSKGIADTSEAARTNLAKSAGISDYNPTNPESNKKLMDAILNSKAVGAEMSKLPAGSPEYNSALGKVTETIAKTVPVTPEIKPAEPLTSTGTKVSEDPLQAKYDEVTKAIDDNNASITSTLNQLRTGAIPLTADQQAVVDSTQRSFDNAIAKQREANKNQENIVRQASFRSGAEYTPEVSSSIIKNVIDANVLKISEYDQQAIAAVAKLKQDFKEANYKAIKEGYDSLQKTLKDKQDNLIALMKLSHDYEKESLNYNLDVLKYQETVRSNMAAEGIKLDKSSGLSDPQKVSVFNRIVDKANASPLIAAADRVPVLKSSIDNIRKQPSDAAQQLNLSYAYIQALDTYQSAVREGELSLVNSIDSQIGKLSNNITKIQNGQIVRPEVALQIANAAQTLVNTIESASKAKMQSFLQQATVSGVGDEFNQYLGGVSQPYGNQNQNGKLDLQSIKTQMELEGKSSDEIFEALRDANLYNASFNQAENASASNLRKAIVAQESGGNYKAVNKDSGALGKYQIMPFNLPGLTGLSNTPANRQKFLNSPQLQDKAFEALLAELSNTYKGDTKKILAAYYGGGEAAKIVGTKAADRPQGKYPSINEYVNQILNKLA